MHYIAQNFGLINSSAGVSTTLYSVKPFQIVQLLLPYIFSIAGIVLLFNLISSGFKLMTSQGEPKAVQSAQAKITTSLIGILILFTSFWIVNLIMKFFGISFGGFGGTNLII